MYPKTILTIDIVKNLFSNYIKLFEQQSHKDFANEIKEALQGRDWFMTHAGYSYFEKYRDDAIHFEKHKSHLYDLEKMKATYTHMHFGSIDSKYIQFATEEEYKILTNVDKIIKKYMYLNGNDKLNIPPLAIQFTENKVYDTSVCNINKTYEDNTKCNIHSVLYTNGSTNIILGDTFYKKNGDYFDIWQNVRLENFDIIWEVCIPSNNNAWIGPYMLLRFAK